MLGEDAGSSNPINEARRAARGRDPRSCADQEKGKVAGVIKGRS